jgi:hypothetical protein
MYSDSGSLSCGQFNHTVLVEQGSPRTWWDADYWNVASAYMLVLVEQGSPRTRWDADYWNVASAYSMLLGGTENWNVGKVQ